jgi:hypothetical protein
VEEKKNPREKINAEGAELTERRRRPKTRVRQRLVGQAKKKSRETREKPKSNPRAQAGVPVLR